MHRLDKHTTGVLVIAKHAAALRQLSALFEQHLVRKSYLAVTVGVPALPVGSISTPIDTRGRRTSCVLCLPCMRHARRLWTGGAELPRGVLAALSEYKVVAQHGLRAAAVEVTCHSGRTHQVRLHCAGLGTPVLGDPAELAPPSATALAGAAPRMHLHALSIALPRFGPGGGWLRITAPLPPHMRDTLSRLGMDVPVQPTERCRWSRPRLTSFPPKAPKP